MEDKLIINREIKNNRIWEISNFGIRLVFMTCWWMWDAPLPIKFMVLAAFQFAGIIFAFCAFIMQCLQNIDLRVAILARDLITPEKKVTDEHLDGIDRFLRYRRLEEPILQYELGLSATCFGAAYLIAHFLFP